jgi:hypothetical protein
MSFPTQLLFDFFEGESGLCADSIEHRHVRQRVVREQAAAKGFQVEKK